MSKQLFQSRTRKIAALQAFFFYLLRRAAAFGCIGEALWAHFCVFGGKIFSLKNILGCREFFLAKKILRQKLKEKKIRPNKNV